MDEEIPLDKLMGFVVERWRSSRQDPVLRSIIVGFASAILEQDTRWKREDTSRAEDI